MTHEPDRPQAIEDQIFALLQARQPGATICPSEVARALAGDDGAWRDLMAPVREVAHTLAQRGRLRVTRGGQPVDATAPGGPIRLGRPDEAAPPRQPGKPQKPSKPGHPGKQKNA